MYNLEPKTKIIGEIANLAVQVGKKLHRRDLAAILNLFGQKKSDGGEYTDTSLLIKKAMDQYVRIRDTDTADNIITAYTNSPTREEAAQTDFPRPEEVPSILLEIAERQREAEREAALRREEDKRKWKRLTEAVEEMGRRIDGGGAGTPGEGGSNSRIRG